MSYSTNGIDYNVHKILLMSIQNNFDEDEVDTRTQEYFETFDNPLCKEDALFKVNQLRNEFKNTHPNCFLSVHFCIDKNQPSNYQPSDEFYLCLNSEYKINEDQMWIDVDV